MILLEKNTSRILEKVPYLFLLPFQKKGYRLKILLQEKKRGTGSFPPRKNHP